MLTGQVGAVQVHEPGVVQPYVLFGVGRLAVEEPKVRHEAGDDAVVARHHGVHVMERHHPVGRRIFGPGDLEGSIGDLDSLRAEVLKVLGRDGFDFGSCGAGS